MHKYVHKTTKFYLTAANRAYLRGGTFDNDGDIMRFVLEVGTPPRGGVAALSQVWLKAVEGEGRFVIEFDLIFASQLRWDES